MANNFYVNCFLLFYFTSELTILLASNESKLSSEKLRRSNDGIENDHNDDGNFKTNEKLIPEKLLGQPSDTNLPVFPERSDAVYFIVAVSGGAKAWGNTLARTLLDMGPPFESPQGPPLRPLFVDLPQKGRYVNFSFFFINFFFLLNYLLCKIFFIYYLNSKRDFLMEFLFCFYFNFNKSLLTVCLLIFQRIYFYGFLL